MKAFTALPMDLAQNYLCHLGPCGGICLKNTLAILLLAASAAGAFAQGKVSFQNGTNSAITLSSDLSALFPADAALAGQPVPTSGPLPSGILLKAGLYGAPSNALAVVGSVIMNPAGGTGQPPGIIPLTHINLPFPGGSRAYFQVKVWDASYATPEDAHNAGSYEGEVPLFTMIPGTSIAYPPITTGGGSTWQVAPIMVSRSGHLWEPVILTQPTSQTVAPGGTASFAVTVDGFYPVFFQWFFNDGLIPGAISSSYQITNVQPTDGGPYFVVITNAFGSVTSQVATLAMVDPFIVTQPVSVSANAGTNVHFDVVAVGTTPLGYQWFKNGGALSDGGNISGAHSTVLTLNYVLGGDAGGYLVVVTNAFGSITSQVATLTVADPFIIQQPSSQSANAETNIQFSVVVGGTPPLAYEWLKNGSILSDGGNVAGAHTAVLTLNNVLGADVGGYSVLVTNAFGSVTSAVATLTVLGLPYTVLHYFTGSINDGGGPDAGLLVWGNRLYGTTWGGGSNGFGTVFGLNTDGSGYAAIHGFSYYEGHWPLGRLVVCGSVLYGTTPRTSISYRGVLFRLSPDGSAFTVLRDFTNAPDGRGPIGTLALSGTTLFGTARNGGSAGYGTVFKVNSDGSSFTLLKNFGGIEGANPTSGLVVSGTTLCGTAYSGGTNNCGTVFRLNMDGSDYTVLKNFGGADGQNPQASPTMSGDVLYGTTVSGGAYGGGTVFRINVDGTGFAIMKAFKGSDGASPFADLVLVGANLYGTTLSGGASNVGTVFQLSTNGTGFRVIKHFFGNDGANPYVGLAVSGTTLYGTTGAGGAFNNGVVFGLALPVPPPTNHPPVAGTPFIKVIGDEVSEIPARRFVIWCSDPDNDPLSVAAVTSPSAMGALVTLEPTGCLTRRHWVSWEMTPSVTLSVTEMAALPQALRPSSSNPERWPRPRCFRRLPHQARSRSTSPDSLLWATRSSEQSRSTVHGLRLATCSPMITGRQASPIGIHRPAAHSIEPSISEFLPKRHG